MKFRLILLFCFSLLVACSDSNDTPPPINTGNTPTVVSAEIAPSPTVAETNSGTAVEAATLPTVAPTSLPPTA
ncbi:MAG TPA: hypothetical protein ENJ56_01090, partial [Anaerolineae bacterium]|nr:hypothetical protein [Anaerolineae bacterium]